MKFSSLAAAAAAAVFLTTGSASLMAQAPGVPIESGLPMVQDGALLDRLAKLRETGKGLTAEGVKAALQKPAPEAVTLPPCRTTPLRPAEVWQSAQRSRLWVGWHFLCHKCDHWHVNLAGGYPITEDGVVATCYHVAEPGSEIKEGRLVAVDGKGNVYPVTSIIGCSRSMDACILRMEGLKTEPLPLNDQVRPGDPAFLLSNPLGVSGYFTSGMVNRFFWNRGGPPPASSSGDELKQLRMHVSTDWAPGSSGSAVLDTCGNAICHVAVIGHLGEGKNSSGNPVSHMTVHEGIPARSVMWLVKRAATLASAPKDANLLTRIQDAIEARDFPQASTLAEELEKAGAKPEEKDRLVQARFAIAVGLKKEPEAAGAAATLADGMLKSDATALNEMAWKLATLFPGPKSETLTTAERISRRSVEVEERRNAASLDTLARVCFLQGKKDEALKVQEEAVNLATGPIKGSLEKTLAEYREGKLPEVKE